MLIYTSDNLLSCKAKQKTPEMTSHAKEDEGSASEAGFGDKHRVCVSLL